MEHTKDCNWIKSNCSYIETHHYCPHQEHACDCVAPKTKWEDRLDNKINELNNYVFKGELGEIEESPIFEFGYKIREGSSVWTITDWGNVKKFIKEIMEEAELEEWKHYLENR